MSISQFAIRHVKAIIFVLVISCLAGGLLLGAFPVSILPEVNFPRLVVIAEAGDRPAEMMTLSVTRPLEEAIATVHGVSKVSSKTQRGASELSIDFSWGADMLSAQQQVNSKISGIRQQLPAETTVSVEPMNPTVFPILGLSLQTGGSQSQRTLWQLATYTMKPRLSRVTGVAQVVVQGGQTPEIAVDVDPQRLTAYGLTLADVEQALTQRNTVVGVGHLDRQFQQYQVLVSGQVDDMAALGDTVITQRAGIPITLRQLADIHAGVQDPNTIVTANGRDAVLINIVRQPDANTIAVAAAVQQEMRRLRRQLPAGVQVNTFYDQSLLVNEAVHSVSEAVLIGAVLSVIILLLFLGDLRPTITIAIILPATLLITFLLMRLAGLTLNLMTLGALAVGIGLIIDDAIVVVENVMRHLTRGGERQQSVQSAVAEIAVPLISSTLTTVVVFLPLVLLTGVTGAFFTGMAITLCLALMVSLALSLLVSPGLCVLFLRARSGPEHGRLFQRVLNGYERLLTWCLCHRAVAFVTLLCIAGITVWLATRLGSGFMPNMDEGAFVLDYVTPPGTSLQESNRILNKIEAILHDTPEVRACSRRTGTELGFAITEPNTGDFAVMLKSRPRRSIDQVMDEVRDKINTQIPGVDVDFTEVMQDLIGDLSGAPAPVEIKLYGEDQQQLAGLAAGLAGKLGKITGVVDAKSSLVESGPELVARLDPLSAGRAGLTTQAVSEQMNAAMYGDVVTSLMDGDRQVGVRVRYPAAARADLTQLATLPLRSPNGYSLPLATVATLTTVPGTTEVNRENQRRMASVTASLSGRDLGSVMRDVQALMQRETLPAGVSYSLGGQFQSQAESFRGLLLVLGLAIVLVCAVMIFQFASYTAPLVILLIMPLSLFGVTLALWLTGTNLNVSSFMGAIMLVGIVVKNGILLLDHTRKGEEEALSLEAAVARAGRVRLRPILMTTLTAILGLLPLALGLGAGAEMQQPLAIAVIGGLTFSTLFTLLFAPLLYVTIRRWQITRHQASARRNLVSNTPTGQAADVRV